MTKDFHFNTADALEKAKADRDKPVTPVEYKPVISDVGSDSNMLWPDKPFVPKGTGKLTLHNAAPVQEPDEWPTGCPECGMDSGCDCDSGTWNPPAAPVQKPDHGDVLTIAYMSGLHDGKKKRAWVGLTDEDKEFIELTGGKSDVLLAELVEAKLKEKNT